MSRTKFVAVCAVMLAAGALLGYVSKRASSASSVPTVGQWRQWQRVGEVENGQEKPGQWRRTPSREDAGEPPPGAYWTREENGRVECYVHLPKIEASGRVSGTDWHRYANSTEIAPDAVRGVVLLPQQMNGSAAGYIVYESGRAVPFIHLVCPPPVR